MRALTLILALLLVGPEAKAADEQISVRIQGVKKPGTYQLPANRCTLSALLEQAGGADPFGTDEIRIIFPGKKADEPVWGFSLAKLYASDWDYALPEDTLVVIAECNYFGGMSDKKYQALEKARADYLTRKKQGKIQTLELEAKRRMHLPVKTSP